MGKQISFIQTKDEETEFLKMVIEAGFLISDDRNVTLNKEEAVISKELSLFILFNNSKIVMSKNGFLEIIESEAIQYSREFYFNNKSRNNRLWVGNKYYNNNGQLVSKCKELDDMYSFLVKWVKRHYVKVGYNLYSIK